MNFIQVLPLLLLPVAAAAHDISVYPGAQPGTLEARVVIGDAGNDVLPPLPLAAPTNGYSSFHIFYNEGDQYSGPWGNTIYVGVYGDPSAYAGDWASSSLYCTIARDSVLFDRAYEFLSHATGGSSFTVTADAYSGGGQSPCATFTAGASTQYDAQVRTDMYQLFYADSYPGYGAMLWGTFAAYPTLPDGRPAYVINTSQASNDPYIVLSATDNLATLSGQEKTFKCSVGPDATNFPLYQAYFSAPSRLSVVGVYQAPESPRCERLTVELSSWMTHQYY